MNFSERVLGIIDKYNNKYNGSLEEYLIGISLAIDDYRYYKASYEVFLKIIEEAFNKSVRVEEWNGEIELIKEYERMQKKEDDENIPFYEHKDEGFYDLKAKLAKYIKGLREYKDLKNNEHDINFWSKIKISTARAWKNDTPFTFLERVASWGKEYIEEETLDSKEVKALLDYIYEKRFKVFETNKMGEEGWYKFSYLIKNGKRYKKRRDVLPIILKSIVFTLSAWIVIPQAIKDELLSTERAIKYFGIIILLYSIMCIILSVVTGCGVTKLSRKIKFNAFEWIICTAIIVVGFII